MSDPLGRKHQTVRKPKNRWRIDSVLDHVLSEEWGGFKKKPSVNHVYYFAYSIRYGDIAAQRMISQLRKGR